MIHSLVALAATAVFYTVSAQSSTPLLYVTYPLNNDVVIAGQPTEIRWTNPSVSTISQISLAFGDPTNLQNLGVIGKDIDASLGSFTWDVPADQTVGSQYAYIFGTSPNLAFSGMFSIQAPGNATTSSSAASGSTLAPSVSSTASSSATASFSAAASSAAASLPSAPLPSASPVSSAGVSVPIPSPSANPRASAAPSVHEEGIASLSQPSVPLMLGAALLLICSM